MKKLLSILIFYAFLMLTLTYCNNRKSLMCVEISTVSEETNISILELKDKSEQEANKLEQCEATDTSPYIYIKRFFLLLVWLLIIIIAFDLF